MIGTLLSQIYLLGEKEKEKVVLDRELNTGSEQETRDATPERDLFPPSGFKREIKREARAF